MKAFWWFEENSIAGMARPGFNRARWFDFSFAEAILVGWIGQHMSGSASLEDFARHVQNYGAKVLKFYPMSAEEGEAALARFSDPKYLLSVFEAVQRRAELFDSFSVGNAAMEFELSKKRLQWEIESLKKAGISKVIALTESHNDKESLASHFDACHFSINDLDAPKLEQVKSLADLFRETKEKKEKVAVHCLAGIGRTSTMIMAAHMLMGESLDSLKEKISARNPVFVFTGRQAEFLTSLAEEIGR